MIHVNMVAVPKWLNYNTACKDCLKHCLQTLVPQLLTEVRGSQMQMYIMYCTLYELMRWRIGFKNAFQIDSYSHDRIQVLFLTI